MITIKRIAYTEDGTFGVILSNDVPFAVTLERQWLDNRRSKSCIPAGKYTVTRCNKSPDYGYQNSPRFGDTFMVDSVPNRSKILFHKGNLDDDSHGCILVGEQFGTLSGDTAILASKHGFDEFLRIHRNVNAFNLEILA